MFVSHAEVFERRLQYKYTGIVRFVDLREAMTDGCDLREALQEAQDCQGRRSRSIPAMPHDPTGFKRRSPRWASGFP
jgi:hypothetical protein